jgi:prevent-host-death family protein
MRITTKELRIQPGRILDQVANGQEITITFRGKALARIVPIKNKSKTSEREDVSIFGLWRDHAETENIEEYVRDFRKGRQF